jgi:acetyl-CoA carboxylase carboxyl transferase subunit alpha
LSLSSQKTTAGPSAWDRVLLARHPDRPHTLDYIKYLFTDFVELHGDRKFRDDPAIVGGLARFRGRTVLVVGHQKGKDTKESVRRNWGMPHPEGYRKSLRLMQQAEKFGFPLITFVDTPAADPGLQSEERGQAVAIAENLLAMNSLKTISVAVVTGEGGSGGALALCVADRILMMENAVYSVASPEASATILWRDASKAPEAAAALRLTAPDLQQFGVIDEIISEVGEGAHVEAERSMERVGKAIEQNLQELEAEYLSGAGLDVKRLLDARHRKYYAIGRWVDSAGNASNCP